MIRALLRTLPRLVARIPAAVHTKLLVAFLIIVGLLIVLGAVGLEVLGEVNRRAEDLVKLQRKIAAYRQLRGRGSLPFIINGRPGVPQLVIAGRAGWAYGDALRRIAAEPGVRYLGHVDEPTLAALYQSASVLALPSLYEGFGLPLLEAMARGVPAVVGSTGALPELAQGAAVEVDAENVDAIAEGLERLLADESLRKKLGDIGRRRAGDYTWESAATRTLGVLRGMARPDRIKVA